MEGLEYRGCTEFAMAASLLLVILSIGALVDGGDVSDLPENRIVGGEQTDISKVPWQVSLQLNNRYHCGGSIISPQWVLTAAHCTFNKPAPQLTVRIGTNSHSEGGNTYQVQQKVEHEQYDDDLIRNDISLMKTMTPMDLHPPVMAVTLPNPWAKRPQPGTSLRVSGWGWTTDQGPNPTLLMAVDIFVVNPQKCRYKIFHSPTQICAFSNSKNACKGDSGGPLVRGNVQVGVVSYVSNKTCGGYPGVYTDVSVYRGWIKEHVDV